MVEAMAMAAHGPDFPLPSTDPVLSTTDPYTDHLQANGLSPDPVLSGISSQGFLSLPCIVSLRSGFSLSGFSLRFRGLCS